MNKKLCFATYVFGTKYHSFIPLYIYSILKAYPDYDVRIYTDTVLSKELQNDLSYLQDMGNFTIICDSLNHIPLTEQALQYDQISKCIRWLYIDKEFYQYDAVYVGDIDIFIIKEAMSIMEQHILHCEALDTCYSNFPRAKEISKSSINCLRFVTKYGFRETLKFLKSDSTIYKLSGLHFFKTKEYLSRVEPLTGKYIQELNLLAKGKSKKWNLCSFNNESLLYALVKEAGFPIPEIKEITAYEILSQTDPDKQYFRPFHGLHLGLWRKNNDGCISGDPSIMLHELYGQYIHEFDNMYHSEPLLLTLMQREQYSNEIVNNMLEYYKREGIL